MSYLALLPEKYVSKIPVYFGSSEKSREKEGSFLKVDGEIIHLTRQVETVSGLSNASQA